MQPLFLAVVKNSDDIRMVEAGNGLGFVVKALDQLLVLRVPFVQDFDRDIAIERKLLAAVNLRKSPAAQQFDKLETITADPAADE
jgi:hypothetical protein